MNSLPSLRRPLTLSAPSITWLLVRIYPSLSTMTPDPPLLCLCRYSFPFSRGSPNPRKNSSKGLPLKKSSPNLSHGLIVIVFSVVILTTEGWTFFATSTNACPRDLAVVNLSFLGSELALSLYTQKKRPKRRTMRERLKINPLVVLTRMVFSFEQ